MRLRTVRARSAFQELRRPQRRSRSGPVTVSFVGLSVSSPDGMGRGPVGSQAAPQFALAVPRRVGSAVVRNKVRRRLKEQLAVRQGDLEPGSYLVAVSAEAGRLGFSELAAALDEALEPFGRQNGKKSK